MDKVLIVAEAGVNHNGSIEIAKQLIEEASKAGADIVKFQTFKAERLVSKYAEKAEYQKKTTDKNETHYDMIKKLELDLDAHIELMNYAKKKGIIFLSTPFDIESIEMLNNLGLEIFKIPSGEINNLPYLRKVGSFGKKVILSTGMSYLEEIEVAIKVLNSSGAAEVIVLHCNTDYPTQMEDVNLSAMLTIRNTFKVKVGYSDHTMGIEIPIAAVALGASVIEKHFTLDRNMEGPDHQASLVPKELAQMILSIRNIEKAIGDGVKRPSKSELKNIKIARKSIVAASQIVKGDIFTEKNLTTKRPSDGISPMRWDEVLGKVAKRDYIEDEMIEL